MINEPESEIILESEREIKFWNNLAYRSEEEKEEAEDLGICIFENLGYFFQHNETHSRFDLVKEVLSVCKEEGREEPGLRRTVQALHYLVDEEVLAHDDGVYCTFSARSKIQNLTYH